MLRDGQIVGFGEATPARSWQRGGVHLEATLNARDFYERAGFREVERSTVTRNGVQIPVVLMENDSVG